MMTPKYEIGTKIKVGTMADGKPRPGIIVAVTGLQYTVEWFDEVYDRINQTPFWENQIELMGAVEE